MYKLYEKVPKTDEYGIKAMEMEDLTLNANHNENAV